MKFRSTASAFVGFALLVTGSGIQASPGDDVAALAAEGRLSALEAGLQGGLWGGTDGETLANAVVETDGLASLQLFEEVANDNAAGPKARTYAWYQIWGYGQLAGDRSRINQALTGMHVDRAFAEKLYGGPLPKTGPETAWAVQIGAFGSRANADRLADQQMKHGFTVTVEPITSSDRTLYAVWVGRFGSQGEASSFGVKTYGTEGRDFRVVERAP
ncbi:MAG: SPOR domain-containing protein [bacterium]